MKLTDYKHLSENGQNWTNAFRAALEDIRCAGGGLLTVPAGVYRTGAIRLFSRTTLEVQAGARIEFLQEEDQYPLIDLDFEGRHETSYQPCVFAEDAEFVCIRGEGTIDGNGEFWWKQIRSRTLKHPRPRLICLSRCRHVTVENVCLTRSPCWTVHPLNSDDVVVRGVRIINPHDSPNTDGINPDGCSDVRIHDCSIDVGDDCIAIKSGTEKLDKKRPSERIIITNCHFLHGHGGIVIGSEMSGGVKNLTVSNCVFHETDRGVRLKTRRGRGGTVEGLMLTNLVMEKVMCPFVFNMYYGMKLRHLLYTWDKAPYPVDEGTPVLRDVFIENVRARRCGACAAFFYGLPEMPVENVTIRNVSIEMDENAPADIPAMMVDAPVMQGEGMFLRNAKKILLENVSVSGLKGTRLDADESCEITEKK